MLWHAAWLWAPLADAYGRAPSPRGVTRTLLPAAAGCVQSHSEGTMNELPDTPRDVAALAPRRSWKALYAFLIVLITLAPLPATAAPSTAEVAPDDEPGSLVLEPAHAPLELAQRRRHRSHSSHSSHRSHASSSHYSGGHSSHASHASHASHGSRAGFA